ncbi:MAG: hypothetical protein U1F43_31565, partial [Myxococcota bacterium]
MVALALALAPRLSSSASSPSSDPARELAPIGPGPTPTRGARTTLAVWPLTPAAPDAEAGALAGEVGDLADLGGLVAAGLVEYLGCAGDAVTALDPHELARGAAQAELVLSGSIAQAGGVVTVEALVTAPEGGPALRVSASGSRRDPLALARALYAALADKLALPEPELPVITTSREAWRALVLAREANLVGHYRSLDAQLLAAERAHPDMVAAKLYRAELTLANDRTDEGKALLAEVVARKAEVSPRDASWAELVLLELDPARSNSFGPAIEAHLRRWPHDLEARIEELHRRFMGRGTDRLSESIPFAEALLDAAPTVPIVASKLVRALAWTGHPEVIADRLAAHGVRPDAPNMASVFAEVALYQKDYRRALELFREDRSDDGQTPYYGLHMALAAEMLAGDPASAAAHAKARIEAALAAGKPIWLDWTYYLWFNALIAAGQLDAALLAVDAWAERTGTDHVPRAYRGWRWELRLLMEKDPAPVLAEIHQALASEESAPLEVLLPMLARIETDPSVLETWIAKLDDRLGKQMGSGTL